MEINNGDSDDNWLPPSEAEMKILEAKRERSDKISKVMGQYLLKGYKMLSHICDKCETILLEDRQHELYCVACSEVDNEHTKDNPALSGIAARRQIEESEHRTNDGGDQNPDPLHSADLQSEVNASSTMENSSLNSWYSQGENALKKTMEWAAQGLQSSVNVEKSIQYCTLLKACADAYVSLKNVQSSK